MPSGGCPPANIASGTPSGGFPPANIASGTLSGGFPPANIASNTPSDGFPPANIASDMPSDEFSPANIASGTHLCTSSRPVGGVLYPEDKNQFCNGPTAVFSRPEGHKHGN